MSEDPCPYTRCHEPEDSCKCCPGIGCDSTDRKECARISGELCCECGDHLNECDCCKRCGCSEDYHRESECRALFVRPAKSINEPRALEKCSCSGYSKI